MLMRPVWLSIDGMTHPLIDNNYESLSCPRIYAGITIEKKIEKWL